MTATKKSEPIYMKIPTTVAFIQDWLNKNDLTIKADIYILLQENRRSPLSNAAIAAGTTKGNRRKWACLPFHLSGKKSPVYIRSEVEDWLEKSVRPILEKEKTETLEVL